MEHLGQRYVTDAGGFNGRYAEVYRNGLGQTVDRDGRQVFPVR